MKRLICIILAIILVAGTVILQTPAAMAAEPPSPVKWLVEPTHELDYNSITPFSEGFATAQKDEKTCVVDKTGKTIATLEDVRYLGSFQGGLAKVKKDGKYGFIDTSGKLVIPTQYSDAETFSEGLCAVSKDGKWGFIDKTGVEIVPCIYSQVFSFSEGFAVVRESDKYGFIDKTGKIAIPLTYTWVESFSDGVALARVFKSDGSGYYEYIDSTGKTIFPQRFRHATSFYNGIALVSNDDVYHFIDKTGKQISTETFHDAIPPSDGLFCVRPDKTWGFADGTGQMVIPPKYATTGIFIDGLACVREDTLYGIIDKTGKVIVPFESYNILYPSEGFVVLRDGDGLYGLVDRTGAFVLPFEYSNITPVRGGLAWAKKDGMFGIFQIDYTPSLDNFKPSLTYETGVTFTDVPESTWFFKSVSDAYTFDIISGVGDNKYNPDGKLTGAEALAIAAKIHAIYKYGSTAYIDQYLYLPETSSNWSGKFVAYCKAEGIIGDELDNKLSQPISRAEMIHVWSKILLPADMARQNTVNSLPDVTNDTPFYRDIIAFYEAGIISGVDASGVFMPEKEITRAECATVFMNLTQKSNRAFDKVYE